MGGCLSLKPQRDTGVPSVAAGRGRSLCLFLPSSHSARHVVSSLQSRAVQRPLDFFRNEKKSTERKSPWPQAVPFRAPGLSEAGGEQTVHPGSLGTQGGPERQGKRVMCGSQDQRCSGLEVWACPGLSLVPGVSPIPCGLWISTFEKGYWLNCAPLQICMFKSQP